MAFGPLPTDEIHTNRSIRLFIKRRRALIMIARTLIIAIAVFACTLTPNLASAQAGSRPPASYSGLAGSGSPGAAVEPTACTVPDGQSAACDSCTDQATSWLGGWTDWLSVRGLGRHHHPNCHCPLCQPRPTWASFDALMWWGKGRSTPILATGEPDGLVPDAEVLFGGSDVGTAMAPGARTDFGFWFDPYETLGMGARFWGVDGDSTNYSADSDDQPRLFRPFHDAINDQEETWPVAAADRIGNLNINTSSSVLGTEAYLRTAMLAGRGYNVDLLGGYSFLRLDDEINIRSFSEITSGTGSLEATLLDTFDARNEFHGGEVGLASEIRHGDWTMSGLAKFSVGNMRQSVRIDGVTNIRTAGGSETTHPGGILTQTTHPGGILAQPTNMGTHTRDKTVWIPEIGVNASYEVREWLRLTIGYSGIWISDVALSGDHIDRVVNLAQTGDPPRPAFSFQTTEYWLHGLNLGATVNF